MNFTKIKAKECQREWERNEKRTRNTLALPEKMKAGHLECL